MNKVFIGLVVAVCILGMALVMLNNRLGRTPDNPYPRPAAENRAPSPSQIQMEADNRAREIAEAASRSEPEENLSAELSRLPATETEPAQAETPPASIMPQPIEAQEPAPEYLPPPAITESVRAQPPQADIQKPSPPKVEAPARDVDKSQPSPAVPQKPAAEPPKKESQKETTPAAQNPSVSRFVVYSRDKGATILIGGTSKMDYSHMLLEGPDRVVVDLNGNWKFPAVPGIPKNDLVEAIRVGKNGSKTRVVIDMKEKPRKTHIVPFKDGQGVDIRVDK